MYAVDHTEERMRLDKWLWAARFFKTRALAKAALEGGKVQCRGERCKPSKEPRVGDVLTIRQGYDGKTVVIVALSQNRRGAPEAPQPHTEPPESRAAAAGLPAAVREQAAAARKAGNPGLQTDGRPTKKQRRQIHQFREYVHPFDD